MDNTQFTILNAQFAVLALLLPAGLLLISGAGLPGRRPAQSAMAGLGALALAAAGYWVCGFAFQMGGVGLVSDLPGLEGLVREWASPLNLDWGAMGLRGFLLLNEASTPTALTLFLACLPAVAVAVLLPMLAIRERMPGLMAALSGLLVAALAYPVAGNWFSGGGWLMHVGQTLGLGHGYVDLTGASTAALVGSLAALLGIIIFGRRLPFLPEGEVASLPVVHVSERGWELGKNYRTDLAIQADVKETLRALLPLVRARRTKEAAAQASGRLAELKPRNWSAQRAKAAVDAMKLQPLRFRSATVKHLRPGQSAHVLLNNDTIIGTIGRLAETVAANYKFRLPVYIAELDLTALLLSDERKVHYQPLPRYPAVVRDLTLLVERKLPLTELLCLIEELQPADYRNTKFVGTYEGPNIPEHKRSVTLRVEYRADERTLRDEEVEERHRSLVASLVEKLGAEQH